ncbi:Dynamin-binding protein [Penicillium chrysogenum]|uniref:Dynamin-binding protein n=1 Tax=Penicillium chrysogenum TaxID=5076 RepID=A0A167SX39_PENCH|nr:Dynamin-binding protein [Penicillium chrysogenum]
MPKSQRCRRTGNRNLGYATDEDQSTMDESVPGLEKDRPTSIVAIWLEECRELASDLTNAWDLDSLLVKPVQRILKYPLFLTQLLELTPIDHPDRIGLLCALQGATNSSVRINEIKRRTDLVGKVVDRKYKKFDVCAGLSRAFGRRTENPRQQVGVSNIFKDKDYEALARRSDDERLQLQLVLRDVEEYIKEAENSMARFNELITAMEGIAEVVQSNYSELESKWRLFKWSVWGITTKALPEHPDVIRKSVIAPMTTLI